MVKIVTILFLSFFVQISFGQVDSNETFLASKGKWALPITSGYILEYKERHNYNGISILCNSLMDVHAVFNGTVTLVSEYDSLFIIVVKYGHCFIGYSNLEKVTVKKGDKIKVGDKIGVTGKNLDEVYGVDMNLSINGEDIDPSAWFHIL